MFKHPITYVDFNGIERKEDFYFHLSTPELVRLEAELKMPLHEYAEKLAEEKDIDKLLPFLEKLILTSYGRKTSDGRSFQKSEEIRKDFEYSQAYAELFEQMLTNPELAKKFGENIAQNGSARLSAKATHPALAK